jgi:HrpA-like RNA helicase
VKREEADKARKKFAAGNRSDHLTLLKAYEGWANAKVKGGERAYCMAHFLSPNAMRMIAQSKRQFVELLVEIGFLQTSKGVFDESSAAGGQPTCDSFQATAQGTWLHCTQPPCFHTA